MSRVFTDYDSVEDVSIKSAKETGSKEYRKLKKLIKKQKKRICRLEAQQSVKKSDPATKGKAAQKSTARKILTKIGDVFEKSLPGILRTAAKIVVATVCRRFLNIQENRG